MTTILIVLLILALFGGGIGHERFGYVGWSPAGVLLVILIIVLLRGRL